MRNTLRQNNLSERARVRIVVALGLVVTLAGFGCTTNRTHAEGEPYMGAPSVGPSSPTSTNGSSVPTTPQPMTSSYRGNEQALATPRPHRLTADEAALVMADHLPRVRVLGPVDPGDSKRPYVSEGMVTGQVQNAAAYLNPQVTINSSITSPGVAAINAAANNGSVRVATSNGKTVVTNVNPR